MQPAAGMEAAIRTSEVRFLLFTLRNHARSTFFFRRQASAAFFCIYEFCIFSLLLHLAPLPYLYIYTHVLCIYCILYETSTVVPFSYRQCGGSQRQQATSSIHCFYYCHSMDMDMKSNSNTAIDIYKLNSHRTEGFPTCIQISEKLFTLKTFNVRYILNCSLFIFCTKRQMHSIQSSKKKWKLYEFILRKKNLN